MSMRTAVTGLNAAQTDLSTIANNIANASTLLLAFFVVMYSISSLNEGKYRVMSASFAAAFRGEPMRDNPIAIEARGDPPSPNVIALPNPRGPGSSEGAGNRLRREAPSLDEIAESVAQAMADLVLKDEVVIRKHEDWLEVEIRNDVLFPSGSANLTPQAMQTVRQLGETLAGIPNPIMVEGHTDNVPINRIVFPSNWELSTARSSAVIRLLATGGVSPLQMTALGFGEHRPIESNESAAGRAANRRVLLAILAPERSGQSLYSQVNSGRAPAEPPPSNTAPPRAPPK